MPIIVYTTGVNKWYKEEVKPATSVGTKKTQEEKLEIRIIKTQEASARSIEMRNNGIITDEELDDAIAKNALCIGMEPDDLREKAQYILDSQKESEGSIERE